MTCSMKPCDHAPGRFGCVIPRAMRRREWVPFGQTWHRSLGFGNPVSGLVRVITRCGAGPVMVHTPDGSPNAAALQMAPPPRMRCVECAA